MDSILQWLTHGIDQLFGRAGGPLNFRLVVMPTVVTSLALRAHFRDVRQGRPTAFGAFVMDRAKRQRLFRSALKDVGRVFVVAIVLDVTYQWWVFRWIYPGQALIVAVTCAVVPYVLVRGPITRLARMLYRKWTGSAVVQTATAKPDSERSPDG
jgi:hypothetical protein